MDVFTCSRCRVTFQVSKPVVPEVEGIEGVFCRSCAKVVEEFGGIPPRVWDVVDRDSVVTDWEKVGELLEEVSKRGDASC